MMDDSNECFLCGKAFQLRKTLYAHIRKKHDTEPDTEGTIKCPQEDCNFSFNVLASLRANVEEMHMVVTAKEDMSFQSLNDFLQWKSAEEKTAKCCFVAKSCAKWVRDGSKTIYICHRSDIFKSRSKGMRQLKSQGSSKMGGHCTAGIEVIQDRSGICSVTYFRTHFGHQLNIGYLRLTRSEKEVIAGKIAAGVTLQRILDDVRDDNQSDELDRLHILSRKDLNNIRRGLTDNSHQFHSNDEVSVAIFLDKIKDCVLMYKKVDDQVDNLSNKDTMIVLMSDLQCELLRRFGTNIVCVDSTHCTNVYKVLLTTLLVIDEFGSGIPVAFCVSNKENMAVMTQFFTCVREKAGKIKPTVFMSDDTNIFRCAWTRVPVMDSSQNILLCAWHVYKSWQNNLSKVCGGKSKKAQVYKGLCMLLEEPDEERFSELLELFKRELHKDLNTREFGEYFAEYYGFRPQLWAYCHRRSLNINTNMHLEAMHGVLKYCYLDGKTNYRLDKLLQMIMKFSRDNFFERIAKLVKGAYSYRLQKIQQHHKESTKIDKGKVIANSNGQEFYVNSQSISGLTYTVTLKTLDCILNCRLSCRICDICIHCFTCSCPDSLVNLNISKHIHAVAMTYELRSGKTVKEVESSSIAEASAILTSMRKENDKEETDSEGTELKTKIRILLSHVDAMDAETRSTVEKEVDKLLSLVPSCLNKKGPRCANNEKVKVQRIPAKHKICPNSTFGKPTLAEKFNAASALRHPDSEVVNVHVGFDHTYSKN